MHETFLPFLGAVALIAMSPGPSTVLIIRNSVRSRRSGLLTVLGNETGVFLWGLMAAFGLTALLAASQLAYDVLRFVGAVVLVVFGVQALRSARRGGGFRLEADSGASGATGASGEAPESPQARAEEAAGGSSRSGWRSYRAGLLLNLANPKAAVFALSFLPQFVPQGAPRLPAMVALAGCWALYEVVYYAGYVWCVGRLRAVLSRSAVRVWLDRVSGGVLLALGLRLALEG